MACNFGFHRNIAVNSLLLWAAVGRWFVSMFVFKSQVVHILSADLESGDP